MTFARVLAAAIVAGCLSLTGAASAQNYPERPVTMIVPFPPGGATDTIARIIQDPMQKALGQPIVVENLGGAGGMIAAAKAARADPDGYTILLHQVALAAGMSMYPDLSFDAEKDFATVGLINTAASTLDRAPDAAAEQFPGAAGVDERARTERQDWALGRRLVCASGRRADGAGTRH